MSLRPCSSDAPIRDFANVPITDYNWPIPIFDPITNLNEILLKAHMMNSHQACLVDYFMLLGNKNNYFIIKMKLKSSFIKLMNASKISAEF